LFVERRGDFDRGSSLASDRSEAKGAIAVRPKPRKRGDRQRSVEVWQRKLHVRQIGLYVKLRKLYVK